MLVGTISRAKLIAFLQSHEHPQAPPGPLQEKVSLGHPLHSKETFFPPQHTVHHHLYPTAASLHRDTWGGLCHRAHRTAAVTVDLTAPGLGWRDR